MKKIPKSNGKIIINMNSETSYYSVFGQFIAQKRKIAGLDQATMADRAGINRSSWSRLENGDYAPNPLQLISIAESCGTSVQDMLSEVDKICATLKEQNVKVHMKRAKSSDDAFAVFLAGAALGALIAVLISRK